MTTSSLTDVLSEIIELLGQCGRSEKAAWLQERKLLLLRSDATEDAREHVANEIHAVVLGMGGLMDLSLAPQPGSSYTVASAQERLDALGNILYDMTR
jgi:hypothetical protein